MAKGDPKFLFGNQTRDNVFWNQPPDSIALKKPA
jgi:hypothetical protein